MRDKNILFTGPPGCGKTTLIEKIVQQIRRPVSGFITREIREKKQRVGFSINTLGGEKGLLAHQSIKSRYKVGRYGVNIADIDRIAVPAMMPERPDILVVIDEIGKMECFSFFFREALIKILDSNHSVIGSISLKGDPFINKIKARKDVSLINITEQNRDGLVKIYANLYSKL